MGENCSYYFLVIGDILVFCFLCFCCHEPDWFYSGGCWIWPILMKTVSALFLILRWPLRHLGFYDMLLIVNRLLIKHVFFCFDVVCGCFVTFPLSTTDTVSGRFYRSISQASCLGFIFIDVFVLPKHLKIFVFRDMADIFWHCIFTLSRTFEKQNKTKQNL